MNIKLIFSFLMVVISNVRPAVEPFNFYKSAPLTHEQIIEHSQMSSVQNQKFTNLVKKHNILPLLQELVSHSPLQTRDERLLIRKTLEDQGLLIPAEPGHESINWNIVVPPHNPEFVVKVPAAGLFRESINAALKRSYGTPVTQADYEQCKINAALKQPWETPVTDQEREEFKKTEFAQNHVDRYQGVSRAAAYLLAQQWRETQRNDFPIEFLQTSLWHVPGRPENLSDLNYVPVEPYINNLKPLTREHFAQHIAAFTQFVQGPVGSIAWDAKPSNMKITPDGKILAIDHESPSNDDPQFFYGNHEDKIASNKKVAGEKLEAFIKWVAGEDFVAP